MSADTDALIQTVREALTWAGGEGYVEIDLAERDLDSLSVELERVKQNAHHTHANLDFCIEQREKALAALREMAEAREDNGVDGSRLLYGSAAADRAHRCLAEIEGEA